MRDIYYPTQYDIDCYNLKVIQCGDYIEIYKYNNCHIRTCRKSKKGAKKGHSSLSDEQKLYNRKKYLNTAKNRIARLVKANSDMCYFFTLTFANEPSIEVSKIYLNKFFDKVRKDYGKIKYLWIIERGGHYGEGRLHYHFLSNIKLNAAAFKKSKYCKSEQQKEIERLFALKYWKQGFVDIRKLDEEGINNISGYVSAYITKSMLDISLVNAKIYNHSRNLNKPIIDVYMTCDDVEDILRTSKEYDLKYNNSYSYFRDGTINYFSFSPKKE